MKFLFVACLLALAALISADGPCGLVRDGLAHGTDLDVQGSTTSVSANWVDFEDGRERNRVLRYEWAVISEKVISPEIKEGACRTTVGFIGVPDVRDWEAVGTRTQASAAGLRLEDGVTYFVVVRATTSMGRQVYANTDGVTVDRAYVEEASDNGLPSRKPREVRERREVQSSHGEECPIDAANRCNAARKSVGEFLEDLYGPPEFNRRSQATNLFRTVPPELIESGSSSSGGGGGIHFGAIIGIVLGVLGVSLCALLVLALVSGVSSKSDKFKTNINRHDNIDEF